MAGQLGFVDAAVCLAAMAVAIAIGLRWRGRVTSAEA
jgi:hypothetical protein